MRRADYLCATQARQSEQSSRLILKFFVSYVLVLSLYDDSSDNNERVLPRTRSATSASTSERRREAPPPRCEDCGVGRVAARVTGKGIQKMLCKQCIEKMVSLNFVFIAVSIFFDAIFLDLFCLCNTT